MFMKEDSHGVLLSLHVVPNAPNSKVIGPYGDALKVKIHAPPVNGKANDEIVRFFAKLLGVSRSQVEIASGSLSTQKKIRIQGLSLAEVKSRLGLPE